MVTATDEADLAKQMERAELENTEVAGDDDDEEDEEGQVAFKVWFPGYPDCINVCSRCTAKEKRAKKTVQTEATPRKKTRRSPTRSCF